MISITSLILIAIPIGLVFIAGRLIRTRGNPDTLGRRYFLFLIWTGLGLSTVILVINWLLSPGGYGYSVLLSPVLIGVVVMALLQRHEWRNLHRGEKIAFVRALIVLAVLVSVQLVVDRLKGEGQDLEAFFFISAIFIIAILLFIVWLGEGRHPILIGLITLLYLFVFNSLEMGSLPLPPDASVGWVSSLFSVGNYLVLPSLVVATIAMLLSGILGSFPISRESKLISWRSILVRSALITALLGYFMYTIVWLCIWDGTDDGVRGLFMIILSAWTAIAAGMLMG